MIEDEKIIEMFFERSEQGIRELDIKYGKVCHKLSYNIVKQQAGRGGMCQRRLLRSMERNPPGDDPHPLLTYILLKSFGTFH